MKSPLITMSAITGNPTGDEIFSYMNSLNENGIEQVLIYPRSGCEIEYLSDGWFEKIGEFINAAKQLDMNIWLYDEFNWPSGHAGGRVTGIEEYRLKSIVVSGEDIGRVSCASALGASFFDEKFFPDLLSHKAVDYFIKCTHEKYYEKFGAYFGNIIKGFFTDEPATAYCCTDNSIPYYDGMKEDYTQRFSRSFTEDMQNGNEAFFENVTKLIGERFKKCFVEKIKQWCISHKVLMTGHLMCDDSPSGATRQSGDFLKNLSAFSVPGIDEIDTDFRAPSLLTLLGSAQYASGENGAMAELFALGPCDMSYATKRCMIYLAACFKINHYFLAVSHMDIRGNRHITDYFNDFASDQPDFSGTAILAEDAKCAAEYAEKDYTPDVYIRYPTEICARHLLDNICIKPFFVIVNKLSFYQLQWKFATKEDDCQNIPVIDFSDNFEYIFEGIVTSDAEKICGMIKKDITVTDADGNIPQGIFVRKFNDASIIVLNLYGEPGTYKICGKSVELEKHGLYVGTASQSIDTCEKRQNASLKFDVSYLNDNMIRAMYINDQSCFEIFNNSDQNVRFAVRRDVSAYLNGKKIECENCTNELPTGFKNLYGISRNICLENVKNALESSGDYKYFPSVFIIGDFYAQVNSDKVCSVTLSNRKTTYVPGEYLNDFGKLQFSAEVYVPKDAKAIEIKGAKLYTCLSINDKTVGEKIYPQYIFSVDENLQGKRVRLSITQYSSLGPVFADVDYFDKNSKDVKWRSTPVPGNDVFGFTELNWIFAGEDIT